MHALIVGDRGVGKSTLINRVLSALGTPVFGFETKKEDSLANENGSPVYIYEAGKERVRTAENLVGYNGRRDPEATRPAFDRFAPKLRLPAEPGSVIIMDELGVMESASVDFCSAVLHLLGGDIPVIAAVKNKDTEFLNTVRTHSSCRCFNITEKNRDELYHEVLTFMSTQLGL